MKKILLTSAALAFALGLSSSAFAAPPAKERPGKVQCEGTSNGTPGAFISAAAQAIKENGETPGSYVSALAKDGGVGDDVQGALGGCGVGSDQPD